MNTNQLIASIAVDLKRVANAYHTNSITTGNRFIREIIETKKQINKSELDSYMKKTLEKLYKALTSTKHEEVAEDALMYSMILQNYYVSRLNTK